MKKALLNSSLLSLDDLEGTENDALMRIASALRGGDTDGMAHQSHSSSSGRGHTSHVSGSGHTQGSKEK